jgi:hypothetical protein
MKKADLYGDNLSSYAVELVLIDAEYTFLDSEQEQNYSDHQSGAIMNTFYIALVDIDHQIVHSDNQRFLFYFILVG